MLEGAHLLCYRCCRYPRWPPSHGMPAKGSINPLAQKLLDVKLDLDDTFLSRGIAEKLIYLKISIERKLVIMI